MTDFAYRAADRQGRVVNGHLQATGLEQALRQLRAKGLAPLQVEAASAAEAAVRIGAQKLAASSHQAPPSSRPRLWQSDAGPKAADVHHLTTQLSVMLRAGLPLDRALRVLIDMSDKPSLTALLEDVLKAVKGGKGLSQALTQYHDVFGDFYINMIRSGEAGGHLAEVLERLVDHLERAKELRDSVISALIYPAILVVVAILSVVLMLGFVVPQFEDLFSDMGEALPLPTRIIVAAGHLVGDWGWAIAIVAFGFVWLAKRWLRSPSGRVWRDTLVLRVPVLGDVARKYELTLFARSMGTLLGNGVPIVNAIQIAADTLSNHRLRATFEGVVPAIKGGGRVAEALAPTRLFTPLALNMVRLGEETGRLDHMLVELARVTDREVQSGVKRLLTLVEPVLILLMGGVIAAIIVSILMGILSVNDLAG